MKKILVIEDDDKLNRGIKVALQKDYQCTGASSIQEARQLFREEVVDLVLLDVNLPDGDGIDFLKEIRAQSNVPVILLTANKMEMDIVTGLESGASDYITKPFSLMVLRARIEVQLRSLPVDTMVYRFGDFLFDFHRQEFVWKQDMIELSKTEQRLLLCLLEAKGNNVAKEHLIDTIWSGESEFVDEHALIVVVNRLRNKLEAVSDRKDFIKTVYGIGYAWRYLQ